MDKIPNNNCFIYNQKQNISKIHHLVSLRPLFLLQLPPNLSPSTAVPLWRSIPSGIWLLRCPVVDCCFFSSPFPSYVPPSAILAAIIRRPEYCLHFCRHYPPLLSYNGVTARVDRCVSLISWRKREDYCLESMAMKIDEIKQRILTNWALWDPQRMMIDQMFMIIYSSRSFLAAVTPTAVAQTAVTLLI